MFIQKGQENLKTSLDHLVGSAEIVLPGAPARSKETVARQWFREAIQRKCNVTQREDFFDEVSVEHAMENDGPLAEEGKRWWGEVATWAAPSRLGRVFPQIDTTPMPPKSCV